ncbi:MAG: carboxypeptidase-like regulatory domain-containing protein, partial [Mucilaginibacter sp.]
HDDHLHIQMLADKKYYAKRDSVGMAMIVTDKDGKPVQGSFSIAVTDDSQIKNDSLKYNSLKSAMLLTSDLKGNIEDPGYYFPQKYNEVIWQHLDNLLLAQGWVNYDWKTVFQPPAELPFAAESTFSVKGRVTNVFNKPVEKSGVVLLSKKPSFYRDTVTDKAGVFRFANIYPSDTPSYFIQAKNKRGKSANVGITIDEFKPPVFFPSAIRMIPWYVNIDSTQVKTISNYVTFSQQQYKQQGSHALKEVKITSKKVIKDSQNINRDGGSDLAFDQKDMENAGKINLEDWLYKNIKNFHLGYGKDPYHYYIQGNVCHFIIDGVTIDYGLPAAPMRSKYEYQKYVKYYLDYYTAEDIKGIEFMLTPRYTTTYSANNFAVDPWLPRASPAYLEITTYSGSGPYMKAVPGIYLYKPLPFAPQKQFYSPKYISKATDFFTDARATIFWSPNIITDKNGKAKFSFSTADKPGSYTLWINGCDMNGNLESTSRKIIVK